MTTGATEGNRSKQAWRVWSAAYLAMPGRGSRDGFRIEVAPGLLCPDVARNLFARLTKICEGHLPVELTSGRAREKLRSRQGGSSIAGGLRATLNRPTPGWATTLPVSSDHPDEAQWPGRTMFGSAREEAASDSHSKESFAASPMTKFNNDNA